jgi:CheY-like chemotaxis protein
MVQNAKSVILIVEDDEVILRALYLAFHSGDYTIATATDGESALKITERLKPDVVLLDLLIPKMNGFEYLKNVKANPALAAIPVVVLSNLGDKEDIEKAKNFGAADYFIKADTDLASLAKRVRKILSSQKSI